MELGASGWRTETVITEESEVSQEASHHWGHDHAVTETVPARVDERCLPVAGDGIIDDDVLIVLAGRSMMCCLQRIIATCSDWLWWIPIRGREETTNKHAKDIQPQHSI